MGDTVFSFGKHRGRSFQEVLAKEPGYVKWALELPSANGQLKEFLDFCKAQTRLPSTDAFAALTSNSPSSSSTSKPVAIKADPAAPQPDQQAKALVAQAFALTTEISGKGEFRVTPAIPNAYVPPPVWQELTKLHGATLAVDKRSWHFQLSAYEAVMQQIRSNIALKDCEIEPLPPWLLTTMRTIVGKPVTQTEEPEKLLEDYLSRLPQEIVEERPVMQFQKEGICYGLSKGGRCLLADEMGLGKTLQALAIIAQYRSEWPVLIIAPSALRLVWRDQALAWLPHLVTADDIQVLKEGKQEIDRDARLLIVSYQLLSRNQRFQRRFDDAAYQVVVVDEAHYIKDQKAKQTGVVLQLCKAATRCVLISGTPAVNRASELFTQLQALLPQKAMPGFAKYCERYCERSETRIPGGHRIVKWSGAKRKSELNAFLLSAVMIRRLKSEVLSQLPKKRRQRITLDPSRLDAEKMREIHSFLSKDVIIDENGVRESSENTEVTKIFKLTAEAKIAGVGEYVEYLLSNDIKFLLFAHHHVLLDGLEEKLKSLAARYIRIDGKTPQNARATLVNQFQEDKDIRVALLSITACGQGLTLTAAHTVVFGELYWVPGQLMQAEDRVHRIGQTEMVDVHYCIAEGTLDEPVFASLDKKNRDTSGILDGSEQSFGAREKSAVPKLETATSATSEGFHGGLPLTKKRKLSVSANPVGISKYFKASQQ